MMRRVWVIAVVTVALLAGIALGAGAAKRPGEKVVDVAWRKADGYAYAVTSTGAIYATPGYCQSWSLVGQVPVGCTPVCLLDGDVGGSLDIACENGQVFTVTGGVSNVTLVPCGNVFGSP